MPAAALPRPLLTGLLAGAVLLAGCAATAPRGQLQPEPAQRRAQARLELASAYLENGQARTALEEVDKALAADAQSAAAHDLRGLALAALGQTAQAQASFERALQLDARDAGAMHNFGWFLCQQQRWDEAQAWLERALAQPGYEGGARSLLALGVCQARAQRWEAAERSLALALERDPAQSAAALNLAEVLLRRGQAERARVQLQRASINSAQADAATLWLSMRIEHRLGRHAAVEALGRELRQRFPQAPQTLALDQGRFDD